MAEYCFQRHLTVSICEVYKIKKSNTDRELSLTRDGCKCGGREGPCILVSSSESPPKLVMNSNFVGPTGDGDRDEDELQKEQEDLGSRMLANNGFKL